MPTSAKNGFPPPDTNNLSRWIGSEALITYLKDHWSCDQHREDPHRYTWSDTLRGKVVGITSTNKFIVRFNDASRRHVDPDMPNLILRKISNKDKG